MSINSKIARTPFSLLYVTVVALISFNWGRVILFQKSFEAFRSSQPWDYYLSNLFAHTFGTSPKEYFIFMLPIVLLMLFILPKTLGKLLSLDKKSNIKGDNHVAVLIILLVIPSLLNLTVKTGIVLLIAFSLLSWLDERKAKQRV